MTKQCPFHRQPEPCLICNMGNIVTTTTDCLTQMEENQDEDKPINWPQVVKDVVITLCITAIIITFLLLSTLVEKDKK